MTHLHFWSVFTTDQLFKDIPSILGRLPASTCVAGDVIVLSCAPEQVVWAQVPARAQWHSGTS